MRYMRTVTHREMRNSSGEILRAVAAGESVQVTNNGQVAAVISPAGGAQLDRLVAQGQARPARRPLADLSTIRRRRAARTSAQLVEDARGRW
jgi:prevent-host-death family protein